MPSTPRRARLAAWVLMASLAGVLDAGAALADPRPGEISAAGKARAAAAFERGVAEFNRAEYQQAALSFLEADELAASPQAITNAIAAARKANDYLLVARAAQRAVARDDAAAPGARAALAEAAAHLARLELSCDIAPCSIRVDGTAAAKTELVLPGDHRIQGDGARGPMAEQHVQCIAGATYQVVLHLPPSEKIEPDRGPMPPPAAPPPIAPPPIAPPPPRGLSPAVFYAGLGVTAVLGGITVWSGVDAIQAKAALPATPEQSQNDAVLARARRTDFLLGGTVLAAAASAVIGVAFTAWGKPQVAAGLSMTPAGASASARITF